MNECTKNILLIFGWLLIIALLIVPYSSFSLDLVKDNTIEVDLGEDNTIELPGLPEGFVWENPDLHPSLSMRDFLKKYGDPTMKTTQKSKIKSTQKPNWYVYHHRGWIFSPYLLVSKKHFSIDESSLTTEIAVILLAAGFAYILFCVVLKKGNK